MSESQTGVPTGVFRSNTALAVLFGDLLVVTLLISAGLVRHDTFLTQSPTYVLSRLAPFLFVWLLVSPLAGLFENRVLAGYQESVLRVAVAWSCTAVLGAVIRAVATSGGASPVFVAVVAGFGLLVLIPWRLAVVLLLADV